MRLLFWRFGGYGLFFFHHFIFFRHFAGGPAKIPATRLEYRQKCRTGQNFRLLTGFDIVALLEIAGNQRESDRKNSPFPFTPFAPFAPLLKPAKCTGSSELHRLIKCHSRRDDDKRPCRLCHSQKMQMAHFRMKQKPDATGFARHCYSFAIVVLKNRSISNRKTGG